MTGRYTHVFAPLTIRGVTFKNRIEMAPPSPNLASEDGKVTREFVEMFRGFARGGAAVVDVGNCVVAYDEARDEERQLDISTDACILPLTRFAEMCESYGCHGSLEINHNGKDSQFEKTGKLPFSASPIIGSNELMRARAAGREPLRCIEMTLEKIRETADKYAAAALRCKRAGMRMCLVHGGHGNLISQFASPLYNHRADEYGGSLENRARFTVDVLDRIRAAVGEDFVIEFRISADEIHPDGMHFDETLRYIGIIKDKIDILHVSAGLHGEMQYMRNWWQNYMMDREYNVHFAADIKKAYPDLIVNTVGSIMDIAAAERIIASGKADFVSMCRPLLADPEMPRKFAEGRGDEHRPCIRCQYCGSRLMIPAVLNCAVNPLLGEEPEFPAGCPGKAPVKKKVAVIGGGPAGIQAALTLCGRGHDVTLYEKSGRLGGALVYAALPWFKGDMHDYLNYLVHMAEKSPARILTNTEATPELVAAENYDALIIAIGAEPAALPIKGAALPHVCWAPAAEADMDSVAEGPVVVIGAGSVGVEAALDFAHAGRKVDVLEAAPTLAALMSGSGGVAREMLDLADSLGVKIHTSCRVSEITENAVRFTCPDGEAELEAAAVLLAAGMRPRTALADSFRGCAPATEIFVVGDAVRSANLGPAVKSAFLAAARI